MLAGGRSARLGGVDKLSLVGPDGRTALDAALGACAGAEPIVVVGPEVTGGPARALAAGVAALAGADVACPVLVLAGDMPGAAGAVRALRASWSEAFDGVVAVAGGRRQYLLGLYRLDALRAAVGTMPSWREGQRGESVRGVLGRLALVEVAVADEAAADLDTWDDVARAGYVRPQQQGVIAEAWAHEPSPEGVGCQEGGNMDEFEVVADWFETLRAHLDLEGLEAPDWQDLLDTVRASAHGVIHAAGPVTAFAAGYAAARAGGGAVATAALLAKAREALPAKDAA